MWEHPEEAGLQQHGSRGLSDPTSQLWRCSAEEAAWATGLGFHLPVEELLLTVRAAQWGPCSCG